MNLIQKEFDQIEETLKDSFVTKEDFLEYKSRLFDKLDQVVKKPLIQKSRSARSKTMYQILMIKWHLLKIFLFPLFLPNHSDFNHLSHQQFYTCHR